MLEREALVEHPARDFHAARTHQEFGQRVRFVADEPLRHTKAAAEPAHGQPVRIVRQHGLRPQRGAVLVVVQTPAVLQRARGSVVARAVVAHDLPLAPGEPVAELVTGGETFVIAHAANHHQMPIALGVLVLQGLGFGEDGLAAHVEPGEGGGH